MKDVSCSPDFWVTPSSAYGPHVGALGGPYVGVLPQDIVTAAAMYKTSALTLLLSFIVQTSY